MTIQVTFVFFLQDDGKGEGDGDGEKRFDGSGYDKDLVEALERDILQKNPNVHWYLTNYYTSSYDLTLLEVLRHKM